LGIRYAFVIGTGEHATSEPGLNCLGTYEAEMTGAKIAAGFPTASNSRLLLPPAWVIGSAATGRDIGRKQRPERGERRSSGVHTVFRN
jgi:hypothetical protein